MVTTEQFDRIRNLSRAKGFIHDSDYIRYAVLEKDLMFEKKFEEIRQAILIIIEELTKIRK